MCALSIAISQQKADPGFRLAADPFLWQFRWFPCAQDPQFLLYPSHSTSRGPSDILQRPLRSSTLHRQPHPHPSSARHCNQKQTLKQFKAPVSPSPECYCRPKMMLGSPPPSPTGVRRSHPISAKSGRSRNIWCMLKLAHG